MISDLDITDVMSTVDIILNEEISIDECPVTLSAFPLLIQCWREGHMGLNKDQIVIIITIIIL